MEEIEKWKTDSKKSPKGQIRKIPVFFVIRVYGGTRP